MRECPVCLRCYSDEVPVCPADNKRLLFSFAGEPLLKERYILEKCIGVGGMGKVYKARHLFLKTDHAIKVILPQNLGEDPELVRRFRQEAVATAAIRHPNIVAVTDFDVINGETPFLVMEYVKGRSLDVIIAEEGALPLPMTLEIMDALCRGVGEAHRMGIIHRDLKPLNVILQEDTPISSGLKILDFGLAKIRRDDMFGSLVLATTKGVVGSPYYMAPEQWSEEQPDARTDIYALGIILYQLLTGVVPFKGPSLMTVMKQHLFNPPPPLQLNTRGISAEVEKVVQRSLAKERAHRPDSVEEFWEELSSAAHPELLATQYAAVIEARSEVPAAIELPIAAAETPATEVTEILPVSQFRFGEQAAILDAALQAAPPEPPGDLDETLVRNTGANNISASGYSPPLVNSVGIAAAESDPNIPGRQTRNLDEIRVSSAPQPPVAATNDARPTPTRNPKVLVGAGLAALLLVVTMSWGLSRFLASPETPEVSANQGLGGRKRTFILDYYIQIENAPNISDLQPIRKDSNVKFHFISRETGFLYLIAHQADSLQIFLSGNPAPGTNVTSNQLEAGADFAFPGGTQWVGPPPDAKEMKYTVIFSEKPLLDYAFLNVNEFGKNLANEDKDKLTALAQTFTTQGQTVEIGTSVTNNWLRNVSLPVLANTNVANENRVAIFEIVLQVR